MCWWCERLLGRVHTETFLLKPDSQPVGVPEKCLLQALFQRLKGDGLHFSATFPTLSFISLSCFLVKTSDIILGKVSVLSLISSWSRSWKERREMAAEIHSKSERLLRTDVNKSGRVRRVQGWKGPSKTIFSSPPAMDKDIFHYIRLLKAPSNLPLNIFN